MKKFFAMTVMALTVSGNTIAQDVDDALDYKPFPYMFVGLQGGMQTTLTNDYKQADLITGTASVSFGAMFTRAIGARIHANGAWAKGGVETTERNYRYDYNYITTNLDLLVNILGLIPSLKNSPWGVYAIGGVGLNTAWNNDDAHTINAATGSSVLNGAWHGTRLSHNLRAGLMVDYRISKHWGINLEVDANSLSDRFNSKLTNNDDWQITAQVGISYRFGYKKKVYTQPVVVATVEEFAEDRQTDVASDAPVVQPKKQEKVQRDIFFAIASTEVSPQEQSKVDEVIEWMKSHPAATATITGHADAGTGNKEGNAEYARQRAENVAKAIVDGGVDAARLTVDSKGDTVMPYGDNEKSRVAIIMAEER